jgi:hypothetical protein
VTDADLARRLSMAVGGAIEVERVTPEIARVHTPFLFADGDELVIRLRELPSANGRRYEWTDLAHTIMHLSYWMEVDALGEGKRGQLLEEALGRLGIRNEDGELILDATTEDLGGTLLQFAQGLLQVADLEYLSQERVRSTFVDDLRRLLGDRFGERAQLDYVDAERDPQSLYKLTCLLNHAPRPVAVLAIPNDDACRDATIALQQFRAWGRRLFATGVFEEQESINRTVLARFTNVVDKGFSSLAGNEGDILGYLEEALGE